MKDDRLAAPVVSFATNDLTIMVPAGNPAHVTDLARPDLPVIMLNPAFDGVARQIRAALAPFGFQRFTQ